MALRLAVGWEAEAGVVAEVADERSVQRRELGRGEAHAGAVVRELDLCGKCGKGRGEGPVTTTRCMGSAVHRGEGARRGSAPCVRSGLHQLLECLLLLSVTVCYCLLLSVTAVLHQLLECLLERRLLRLLVRRRRRAHLERQEVREDERR